jgi:photosystem II stability/assembly factor-like uncharacterized protein
MSTDCRRWRLLVGASVALALSAVPFAQRPGFGRPPAPEPLTFRFMGPAVGNRISAVAGVPGDPQVYYAGAASGGVWKSTDGGASFKPIFDDMPVAAIGALAVAPSDPNIVWVGTGEAWVIRDVDMMGDGVYKSTDAGATWTHMGLPETGRIGRVIVHPTNPDIVYVCALGRTTGPQQERGVFKTTDGGRTWNRVLFADENTGCSGLAMDPRNPNVLFAGTWQVVMHTWAMFSGGPGSAIYKTADGGTTWSKVESPGLPRPPLGKIDVAFAATDSNRVYALIQTADQGSLWRSDDGGGSWKVASWDRTLIGRAGYYIRLAVNPANPDEVLVASSSMHRSTDGGLTFPLTDRGCGDCHDIWMDPKDPNRWVTTGDGGMGITTDHAKSFTNVTLPIGQMYHVAVDDRVPYWIYGNMQDDGTMRGRSDSPERLPGARGGGFGRFGGGGVEWEHGLGGCESGFTLPDPSNPDVVWATCYGNKLTRFDATRKVARSVSPWMISLDSPPNDAKYRCHWTAPLAVDPFDPSTVYYGCQVIFSTSSAGQTWKIISPDLSTQDPSRIVSSGGIVGDNLGQFYGEVVFAIAPSPIREGLIWAGTNDGKVWYTPDRGVTWNDVTKNITGLPAWGTVSKIEPSHFDPATAYVAVDFHLMDDRQPYLYKTDDYGKTWTKIVGDLPAVHPLDYVRVVAENPNRRGMLFAGTGHALFYSMDDGVHWTQLRNGLPPAPVSWIVVQKRYHDLVVSTYGRGFYIMSDITPLEQKDGAASAVRLFTPRPGFRLARGGDAQFHYTLASAATSAKVEVLDADGAVIRTLDSPSKKAGLNRVTWDLRYEQPQYVELRATPAQNPHVWDEPRFKDKDVRPVTHWGMAQAQVGPLAAPGKYAVRLTVDGQQTSQPFEVAKDPSIPSPDEDLVASTATQVRIRDDIDRTSGMINHLEALRRQVQDQLAASAGKDELEAALRAMEKKLEAVEFLLIEEPLTLSDDKFFVEAYKVYANLIWLNGAVSTGAGDVAGGADFRPTDAQLQVLANLEKDLEAAAERYKTLMDRDVPAFNRTRGVQPIK